MSEEEINPQSINDQLVLISGESTTGKSASLQNMRNQERVLYVNCEAGKRLPFRNKFHSVTVTDPYQVYECFDYAEDPESQIDVIVIDTLTFLMDMFESQYIIFSENTMQGWSDYAQFFKNLMQIKVAKSTKQIVFMAHTRSELNETKHVMETSVPVKGALKGNGLEAYFSCVVSTKKETLKVLEEYDSDLLNYTETDKRLKYKHVFQTQLTEKTIGERIRTPMGMFTHAQTFMDNDVQLLLDHLTEYYS